MKCFFYVNFFLLLLFCAFSMRLRGNIETNMNRVQTTFINKTKDDNENEEYEGFDPEAAKHDTLQNKSMSYFWENQKIANKFFNKNKSEKNKTEHLNIWKEKIPIVNKTNIIELKENKTTLITPCHSPIIPIQQNSNTTDAEINVPNVYKHDNVKVVQGEVSIDSVLVIGRGIREEKPKKP
jgi:hypothetical protein